MIRAAACLLLLLAACRTTPLYRAPVTPDAKSTYRALVADGNRGIASEDEALWRCELASAAIMLGKEDTAFRALDDAARVMGTLESTSTEDARAILGEEATKTWKGDPYERCMNAFYKGILYWRRGDLDNASACFKRGLLADAWSEVGEHQRDFAALSFMLGWVSHLRGKTSQADFSFKEAASINPSNPFFVDPRPHEFNILVVVGVGRGPRKYATGPDKSVAGFTLPATREAGIELVIDGQPWGASAPATDLYVQATTRGKKEIDGIRHGKAIFKGVTRAAGTWAVLSGSHRRDRGMSAIGAGLLILSALTHVEADTRHWALLPAELHVLPLYLEPGVHRLEVRGLDWHGGYVSEMRRTFDVTVPPGRNDLLYYFRTGLSKNIYGLTDPAPEK